MDHLQVSFSNARYKLLLGTRCVDEHADALLDLEADAYFVVADTTVATLYGNEWLTLIRRRSSAHLITHESGEHAKRLSTVEHILENILALGATRASCIVALGGGTTGNLAGLIAALAFRGIRLVHVPTTLVALLDSVFSLKQAVNASLAKNLIGTFYCPEMVLADTAHLETLPLREVRSGLCEVVKNALGICPDQIGFLRSLPDPAYGYTDEIYTELTRRSLRAKSLVMHSDAHECRAGLVLEYGHTVGHALEQASDGLLSHGEAVGMGMLAASEIAQRIAGLSEREAAIHYELLNHIGAPVVVPSGIRVDDVHSRLRLDNKRGHLRREWDGVAMVLLRRLGQPCWSSGRPLKLVSFDDVEQAIATISA